MGSPTTPPSPLPSILSKYMPSSLRFSENNFCSPKTYGLLPDPPGVWSSSNNQQYHEGCKSKPVVVKPALESQ